MNKEILQIQLAFFFQQDYVGSFEDFSLKLKNILGESKVTQHIPVPIDAPSEIPRLILGYESFNINVSKNRLDLFVKEIEPTNKRVISIIHDVISTELSLSVGRFGFVKKFFIDGKIEDLKKIIVKEKVEKLNLKEINIRVNEIKLIEGYNCNNIESLSYGFLVKKAGDSEVKKEGIILVRDINTLLEELKKNRFEKEKIDELINSFNEESDRFIIYFDNSKNL